MLVYNIIYKSNRYYINNTVKSNQHFNKNVIHYKSFNINKIGI